MHGAPAYGEATQPEVTSMPRQGPEGILGRRWWLKSSPGGPVPESLGDLGGPGGRRATQEAQRNRTETCAKRYAQCGLGDMSLQKHGNYCIFLTWDNEAKDGRKMGREICYAQCRFGDMSALKRFMLGQVHYIFYKFAKLRSIDANIK